MADIHQLAQLFNETLSSDGQVVLNATQQLDRLSISSDFPFSLLSFVTGDGNQGLRVAAATYLKNLIRRNVFEESKSQTASFSKEFKNKLLESLLRAEMQILNVLVEAFRFVVDAAFVKNNSWPELVPELRFAIQNSDLFSASANSQWLTLNALRVLQTLIRPFQYFLNPKVAKEPVPPQLEQIACEILVPLLSIFHNFVEKATAVVESLSNETERLLLTVCKCIYYAVRSYMPSSLAPLLPSFCHDLFGILDSLSLEEPVSSENSQQVRTKTAKRTLLIFCALVTRHRKYSDKLMPDIMKCVVRITRCSTNISKLDSLPERIISLAFDVISHVLETGPGWRLVSPHFASLLNSSIMPALMLNQKDIEKWEEDADEFISKNLPSDLEEISGWRDNLFTVRKSAVNLLGVISMSKGPPAMSNDQGAMSLLKRKKGEKKGKGQSSSVGELLVLPFLSKFPIPYDNNAFDSSILYSYFGVLMGYGALQDFLSEQKPEYTKTLIYNRVLPLYKVSTKLSYLLAAANWILGELASCLPEEMTTDIYSALLKALAMPDCGGMSGYPVRASAAGAIAKLLENEYLPPDWLPLLQVIVGRIGNEEEEIPMLFQLLSSVVEAGEKEVSVHMPLIVSQLVSAIAKYMPANPEPWSRAAVQGFATLAVMAKSWQNAVPEDEQDHLSGKWATDRATIARSFSSLLQQAWIAPKETTDGDDSSPQSCIDDASTLLWFIMRSITGYDVLVELKVSDLLSIWAGLIADWHGSEEVEDLSIFDCIREVVSLHESFGLKNFFMAKMPSPPAPPVPEQSIIESIAAFVCEAFSQYPSAAWRACSCIHLLLHVPCYSFETENIKQSLVVSFSRAVVSRFKDNIQSKPCSMWKPLLLAISSCYLCYPDIVVATLEKALDGGFVAWASALNSISSSSFTPNTSMESEIKLVVITLAKVIEQLLIKGSSSTGLLWECFTSLLAALVRLKEVQEETGEEENEETGNDEEEDTDYDYDYDDEDSDNEMHEETEEQFLERYAQAAAALENGTCVEEGDAMDHDEELELGTLRELDEQRILHSLLKNHHQILTQKQSLFPHVICTFLTSFPEYGVFFQ